MTGGPAVFLDLPWVLLGTRLGLDDTGRVFLLFTAALWIASGVFARAHAAASPHPVRFLAFFLASMAGSLGVVVAADAVTFYFCFAVMSFASYVLVIDDGRAGSRRAGRVYIAFVVVGEVLLFVGIAGAAALAASTDLVAVREALARPGIGRLLMWCLFLGFGIKAGVVPLHMWLPLAYSAAPIPASAALSGPMIKAGLLGWLRFLPIGDAAYTDLAVACIAAGLAGAFWGVVAGLAQDDAKTALAYSSVSQMGLIATAVGVGLYAPAAWGAMLPAIWLYALHHALAKSALFLGTGVLSSGGPMWRRRTAVAGLAVCGAALAGVPFSSGAAAKVAVKGGIDASPLAGGPLDVLLSLAAVGTTLLMARFLVLAWRREPAPGERSSPAAAAGWLVLVAAVALVVWLLPGAPFRGAADASAAPSYVWSAFWPAALGIAIAWVIWRRPALAAPAAEFRVPPGDILALAITRWTPEKPLAARRRTAPVPEAAAPGAERSAGFFRRMRAAEVLLLRWDVVGALASMLAAALYLVLRA